MTRFVFVLTMMGLLCAASGARVGAQAPDSADTTTTAEAKMGQGDGRAVLSDWPASLERLHADMGAKAPFLLPKIDSLTLDYRYAAGDSTSQWSFVLGWAPGDRVLYEGSVVPRRRAPSGLRMTNIELRAEVRSAGERVGHMIVAVDSMALAPSPSVYSFEVTVRYDRVLFDTSATAARAALQQGATLHNLVVERMGFVSSATSTSDRRSGTDRDDRQAEPRPRRYESSTRILVGWRVAPRPYYIEKGDQERTVRPREDGAGRQAVSDGARPQPEGRDDQNTEETDGGQEDESSSENDDEDEEDEEDTSLRVPALAAVAAVGMVAYVGGTVGLYGRGDTPIGLAAGYTQPGGGVQLHAAVNPAVITDDPNQKLTLKAFGFYDVFGFPLQPAVGLGVQIDPSEARNVVPSASLGLALNAGRIVLFGAVDGVQRTPEVGLTYNFRH